MEFVKSGARQALAEAHQIYLAGVKNNVVPTVTTDWRLLEEQVQSPLHTEAPSRC